jgi:hypothetical protein
MAINFTRLTGRNEAEGSLIYRTSKVQVKLQGRATSRFHRNLHNVASVHFQQSFLVICELEYVGYHTLDVQFTAIDVGDSAAECQILGKG